MGKRAIFRMMQNCACYRNADELLGRKVLSRGHVLFLISIFVFCLGKGVAHGEPTFGRGTVILVQGERRVTLEVEVAENPEARTMGLMHRAQLPVRAGMFFIFHETERQSFWMKNTLIPLSIAFISPSWKIVEIQHMDPPRPAGGIPSYQSKSVVRYALEVNQGFFRRSGIEAGAHVMFLPAK